MRLEERIAEKIEIQNENVVKELEIEK